MQAKPHVNSDATPALPVDTREAARLLCVCERTLWALADSGQLPHIEIGKAARFAVTDLHASVQAKCTTPPPA
jgi:excisionase family DNA binding protein